MVEPSVWSAPSGIEVCICGVGARTPLGFSAVASAAAVRGAISAIAAHPILMDKAGEPIAIARDASLDVDVAITQRMQQMLVMALSEAVGETLIVSSVQVECWIGLPEPRPGLPINIGKAASHAAANALGIEASAIHVLPRGHASGLMAMQAAAQRVCARHADICIVAGVDSYHDVETLDWMDQQGLLMSSVNRNGFPPGEAAGVCLLAARSTALRLGLPVLAKVTTATTTVEPHPIRSTEVCIGEGLSQAVHSVTSILRLPQQAITATYCDLNGERYRNEELVYTLLRVQKAFVHAHDYNCPADCWGDVGAASGPLFASLAIAALQRGYAKGLYPLLWAGSESGHRAAIVLELMTSTA